jgi:6,7-dimethyl-8-ribityllumazine synthase
VSRVRPHDTAPSFEPGDRVAVLASRWNDDVIARLLDGCRDRLDTLGATIEVFRVPGAFELPTAAKWAAEDGRFEAVICLGCVIRGETPHFDYVAGEAARGIARVGLDTGVPCIFGVLTVESHHQALDRVGGEHGHAGVAAAEAAAEMVALRRTIAAA